MTPDADRRRSRRSDRSTIVTVVAAVAACSVCCAGPLLAVLGGLGTALGVGAIWVPALGIVAAVPLVGGLILWRRRSSRRCGTTGPVQLGMPVVPSAAAPSPDIPAPKARGTVGVEH